MNRCSSNDCCPHKTNLKNIRDLKFDKIKLMFKTLSNETRLKLLYELAVNKEMYATNIATAIKMRPQAVSNQLQQLLSTNVLKCERKGNHLLYSIKDPCMVNLLEQALCMNQDICPRNI